MKKILAALFTALLAVGLAPPATATHAIDFGAFAKPTGSQTEIQAYQALETLGGDLDVSRFYSGDWNANFTWTFQRWAAAQGHSMNWSLHAGNQNPSIPPVYWADVTSGAHDAYLVRYAEELQGLGTTVWFSWHHEPEINEIGGAGSFEAGTRTEFVASASHVYDVMKPACPNCFIGLTFLKGTYTGGNGGINAWLPNPSKFDFLGVDVYDRNANLSLATMATPALDKATSLGKDFVIPEAGTVEKAGVNTYKANWFKAARTWLKTHAVDMFCYSNTPDAVTGNHLVNTTPKALNAWKAMTGDPYFK